MTASLALLSSLLWGTADFLGGTVSRRVPISGVVGASQLAALLGLLPCALLAGGFTADRSYLLPAIAAGLVGLVALSAFYRALSMGTMAIVAPVAALGVLVPVGVALARGEAPDSRQLVGLVVAVLGVVLASGPDRHGGAGRRPLLLAVVAACGFGLVIVLIADGSRGAHGSVVMTLLTMRLTSVLALTGGLLLRAPWRGWEIGVRRADLAVLVVIGAADVLANATFGIAARSGLVSVTAALSSLYPVVTVLLAYRVHGERLRQVQQFGVLAALTGAVLLAAG